MADFNSLFPHFLERCVELKSILMPVAYVLFVVGMVSSTISGRRSPSAYLRAFERTGVYVVLVVYLVPWGNELSQITDTTVREVIKADPGKVFEDYTAALVAKKSSSERASWWDKLFNAGTSLFEAIVSGFLWLFGLLASAIVFYAYIVQKMVLYLGYSLSPLFIGFMAVKSLSHIGAKYLLSLAGVIIWPLGWAEAAIITSGLLDFMVDQSFLHNVSVAGGAGYGLQNLLGLAILGVWLIASTIAAPMIIQRALSGGFQAGAALLGGVALAGANAIRMGATTTSALGSSGGFAGLAGGVAAGAAATAGSLAESAHTGGHAGSLINTLAHLSEMQSARRGWRANRSPNFAPDDLTGDKAVQELLRKPQNPSS